MRLGGLEVLLGQVLHAGPQRLLADEVGLDAVARARRPRRPRRACRRPGRRARPGSPRRRAGRPRSARLPASRLACAATRGRTARRGRSSRRPRSTRSTRGADVGRASRRASGRARRRATRAGRRRSRSSAASTASEPEPGTTKPPLVRCSVWRAAKGADASSTTSQAASTSQRRRSRNASSLSIAACISSLRVSLAGRTARQSDRDQAAAFCDLRSLRPAGGARSARPELERARSSPSPDRTAAACRSRRPARRSPRPPPRRRRRADHALAPPWPRSDSARCARQVRYSSASSSADLLRVARGAEHLVDHGGRAGVVLEEVPRAARPAPRRSRRRRGAGQVASRGPRRARRSRGAPPRPAAAPWSRSSSAAARARRRPREPRGRTWSRRRRGRRRSRASPRRCARLLAVQAGAGVRPRPPPRPTVPPGTTKGAPRGALQELRARSASPVRKSRRARWAGCWSEAWWSRCTRTPPRPRTARRAPSCEDPR